MEKLGRNPLNVKEGTSRFVVIFATDHNPLAEIVENDLKETLPRDRNPTVEVIGFMLDEVADDALKLRDDGVVRCIVLVPSIDLDSEKREKFLHQWRTAFPKEVPIVWVASHEGDEPTEAQKQLQNIWSCDLAEKHDPLGYLTEEIRQAIRGRH